MKKMLLVCMMIFLVSCQNENLDNSEIKALQDQVKVYETEIESLKASLEALSKKVEDQAFELDAMDNIHGTFRGRFTVIEEELDAQLQQSEYLDIIAYRLDKLDDLVEANKSYEVIRGLVKSVDIEAFTLALDVIEFVPYYDDERVAELNIDTENEPIIAGAYLYNSPEAAITFNLSDSIEFYVSKSLDEPLPEYYSASEFTEYLQTHNSLCNLELIDGKVVRVTEFILD